ncbi:MAG: hypothetical protein APF76_14450 [Desulfitibacter sp. BRH_c19]|nr:MAG: hypothetical protein APF76_14450 [Desulfitibacter sp. BRH_c19]
MDKFMSYDPWRNIITRNGIPGDEIISALQKSIRRGLEEDAVVVAYEMYITSPEFEEKLWRRLLAISVEDIGFGDINAPVLINSLNQMRKSFPYNDGDRPIFFVHAIRYLCQCEKERSGDCLKNVIIKEFEQGKKPVIPDYALDMHTRRGRELGRDFIHFLEEASKVSPEKEETNSEYKHRLIKILKEDNKVNTEERNVPPFSYNTWQA